MSPQRIQRQRRKGWTRPDNAVIVDRTSRWGNPFTIGRVGDMRSWTGWFVGNHHDNTANYGQFDTEADARAHAVKLHREWLDGEPQWAHVQPQRRAWILANLHTLAGKTLVCACAPDSLCHADTYAARIPAAAR
ncbi:DUF4326 domain-containing protein [Verrucosispora sp. NA02020]|uniref:DUF4326 domain-containing protein n=1 Tax=Verrucosispora sp. NA02020 TaxID=2742132 RepID=UPI00159105FE|nr:DUF4326 domain-containing protein [Verrucosispora sp. NA02020]QKW15337.1 DUF4326 domain-containing protein [Verrucosispora sp. NA02020]